MMRRHKPEIAIRLRGADTFHIVLPSADHHDVLRLFNAVLGGGHSLLVPVLAGPPDSPSLQFRFLAHLFATELIVAGHRLACPVVLDTPSSPSSNAAYEYEVYAPDDAVEITIWRKRGGSDDDMIFSGPVAAFAAWTREALPSLALVATG